MERSSLKKKKKADPPPELFQIVGENDNDDNLDLEWLESVDFTAVDKYDPNRTDDFRIAFQQ